MRRIDTRTGRRCLEVTEFRYEITADTVVELAPPLHRSFPVRSEPGRRRVASLFYFHFIYFIFWPAISVTARFAATSYVFMVDPSFCNCQKFVFDVGVTNV